MGLLSNIFKSAKKRGVFIGTQAEYFASRPDIDYGVPVTNQSAMNLTAFFDGIRIISENIASLPKEVFRSDPDKGPVEAHEHAAFSAINVRPNAYTNVFDFWSCIVTWLIGWGNAYAIIRRDKDGGQYGVCILPDGTEVEEWELFRRDHAAKSGKAS